MVVTAEEKRDAAALTLDKKRAWAAARLLEAAEDLDVRDAEERWGKEREASTHQLGEAEGILEDTARQRSEKNLIEPAAADELAKTE